MSELNVVATIPAKPENADEVRAAVDALVTATRQESGCLAYAAYESAAVPGTFVTVERWTDQAALDAHMGTEHIAEALGAVEGKLAGDIAIHPLQPVGSA